MKTTPKLAAVMLLALAGSLFYAGPAQANEYAFHDRNCAAGQNVRVLSDSSAGLVGHGIDGGADVYWQNTARTVRSNIWNVQSGTFWIGTDGTLYSSSATCRTPGGV